MFRILLALVAAALTSCVTTASAASHDGRLLDGPWYQGTALSTTYGKYRVSIQFNGERVYLRFANGASAVGILDDENIEDPREFTCEDERRDVRWTVSVEDLGQDPRARGPALEPRAR